MHRVGIQVTLRRADGRPLRGLADPNGGTFDAAGDFDDMLGSPDLPVLGGMDPYGETTFDARQTIALIADVDSALGHAKPGPETRGLHRLRAMAEMCQTDESLTLHVLGD
jgi:hypothetical protein